MLSIFRQLLNICHIVYCSISANWRQNYTHVWHSDQINILPKKAINITQQSQHNVSAEGRAKVEGGGGGRGKGFCNVKKEKYFRLPFTQSLFSYFSFETLQLLNLFLSRNLSKFITSFSLLSPHFCQSFSPIISYFPPLHSCLSPSTLPCIYHRGKNPCPSRHMTIL